MILFSIIIPTYNRADFIAKAIDSVFSQSYSNWELIVVDDASTDHTPAILSTYVDARIVSVRNEINKERSSSRNRGIQLAKGDYICFLDSDDYFLPDHLQNISDNIQSQSLPVALFHTDVVQVDWSKGTQRMIERPHLKNSVEEVINFHIPVISVAVHRDILKAFQFDAQLRINEDVHLFARIASRYPLIHVPYATVVWMLHGSNTINNEKDYLTPELVATQIIFKDPLVSLHLRADYKRKKYFELYSRLIYFHASNKKSILSISYFIKGLLSSPLNRNNWTNLLNVIYHLPGGKWVKRIVQLFKN